MPIEPITVSSNRHFLVTESGKPFFWLGDTAWELFHRLKRAEAELYLETRRRQGFNVILAVILSEIDARSPNANGHIPLLGDDPTRPNEYYFRYVDELIRLAASKGLYVGLLPTWGDKVDRKAAFGNGPAIFTLENSRIYGRILGERYRQDSNILWVLGGDRSPEGCEAIWTAMAEGICEGLGRRPFCTYHSNTSSSEWLHDAAWLDMNTWQSGHILLDAPNWEMIEGDYRRCPPKPVLDAEPNYEDHPIDPFQREWEPKYGRYSDYDTRKQAYRAVLSGACGHTYGHHSVWQFWKPGREPRSFPSVVWNEAIFAPGAKQMIHLKNLFLSRPYWNLAPAQEMLLGEPRVPPVNEQEHYNPLRAVHVCAARCVENAYALIYIPQAEQFVSVDLSGFKSKVKAWWYDPRNGKAHPAGEYPGWKLNFISPIAGPDWVLVLDTVDQQLPPPGVLTT